MPLAAYVACCVNLFAKIIVLKATNTANATKAIAKEKEKEEDKEDKKRDKGYKV